MFSYALNRTKAVYKACKNVTKSRFKCFISYLGDSYTLPDTLPKEPDFSSNMADMSDKEFNKFYEEQLALKDAYNKNKE